jgi:hypothetical protein
MRMTDANEFWSDFRARARLHPQLRPERRRAAPGLLGWSVAAACVLVLIVGGILFQAHPARAELSHVQSMKVFATHSAVLIMDDTQSQSTIVWVADMEENGGNGEVL